jgi:hypothetical protein
VLIDERYIGKFGARRHLLWAGTAGLFSSIVFFWVAIGMMPSKIAYESFESAKIIENAKKDAEKRKNGEKVEQRSPREELDDIWWEYIFERPIEAGVIGDQFGMVNSLFSGLALFGVGIAIVLQSIERRDQEKRHDESIKHQRAELDEVKRANVTSHHFQAIQTYMEVTSNRDVYNESLNVREREVHDGMVADILSSIKYMRESGNVDEGYMRSLRSRVAESLEQLSFNPSRYWLEDGYDLIEVNALGSALRDINWSNIGNGILPQLIQIVDDESKKDKPDDNKMIKVGEMINQLVDKYLLSE